MFVLERKKSLSYIQINVVVFIPEFQFLWISGAMSKKAKWYEHIFELNNLIVTRQHSLTSSCGNISWTGFTWPCWWNNIFQKTAWYTVMCKPVWSKHARASAHVFPVPNKITIKLQCRSYTCFQVCNLNLFWCSGQQEGGGLRQMVGNMLVLWYEQLKDFMQK